MRAKTREAQKKSPGLEHPGSGGATKTRSRNPSWSVRGQPKRRTAEENLHGLEHLGGRPRPGTGASGDWRVRGGTRGRRGQRQQGGERGKTEQQGRAEREVVQGNQEQKRLKEGPGAGGC